jgi:hypothetical protein
MGLELFNRCQVMVIRVNICQNPKILARLEDGRSFHRNPELLQSKVKNFSHLFD